MTSLLLNYFQKKTSQKIVAYKPLLIKHNECKTIILIQRREIFVGIEMIFFVPKNNLERSKDSQLQGGSKSSEVKIVRLTFIIYV